MLETSLQYDVIVIGGGPGGAMAATLLADYGKQVLVLESERFPRYHIGESLIAGTVDLLRRIGVLDRMESAGFIKKYGVQWVWGENREPWTVYFKDALTMVYGHTYQVERGQFDKMLLDNAAEHGADVREEHKVVDFDLSPDDVSTVDFVDPSGTRHRARARWIVDASGQGGVVSNRLHKREWDPFLKKNMAVWTYWKNAERPTGLDAGNTFLPSFEDGWWWFIPLSNDITSVGMVVDTSVLQEYRDSGMESYYAKCLAATPELAARLQDAEQVEDIKVARDWSYAFERFSGDGYIAVGDAACFIDPLFSTGVHLALLSGFLGAVTINTILDKTEIDRHKVLDFYERTYRAEFSRLRDQVYVLYSGQGGGKESYFWHARNKFEVPGITPEKAFISLIAGAFAHRPWYGRYLDQLDIPSSLRDAIEDVFAGNSTGIGVDPGELVCKYRDIAVNDDFAIDGEYLRAAQSVVGSVGVPLALTPAMESVLAMADGSTSSADLVDRLIESGDHQPDPARRLVHEAISYGLIVPQS
ncbi:NAD(P)/FAD-dependent oxidoreductase [Nocardia nepalensis]|uniref:NAD(P)/FAD-dependent oxidoreductase n=1 Tax=Nocardia nepalensis TaxID=3375448 RepID=UPI003B67B7B4